MLFVRNSVVGNELEYVILTLVIIKVADGRTHMQLVKRGGGGGVIPKNKLFSFRTQNDITKKPYEPLIPELGYKEPY
jgi:hypothetical protein